MARIYREMPVNSIWEGSGNIMAIDLLRALRRGPVAEALAHELAPLKGAYAAVDAKADATLQALDGEVQEIEARRLARDVALLVQASLLRRHAPDVVFDAFCRSRLGDGAADVFGLLRVDCGIDAIVARALPGLPA
jgi:putative acyl-CoA dehydrogenase